MPYLLSAVTIYMFWLAGNKKSYTWLVGLGNQVLWLTWIIVSHTWGLLPLTAALTVMYIQNHLKWKKQS